MTLVKFASVCDIENCDNRSEEYATFPTCRACMLDICPEHTVPGSLRQSERDRDTADGTEAIMTESVYCLDCLATWGAE